MAKKNPKDGGKNSKSRKNLMDGTALEPTILYFGNVMPRCQARAKSSQKQCRKPSVEGKSVCSTHGAGTKKRVKEGTRKPAGMGRPAEHKLYSSERRDGIDALVATIEDGPDIERTNTSLAALKADVMWLLQRAEDFNNASSELEELMEVVSFNLSQWRADGFDGEDLFTKDDFNEARRTVDKMFKLVTHLQTFRSQLAKSSFAVIAAVEKRANTRAKSAEERALNVMSTLALELRRVAYDYIPADRIDNFEAELKTGLEAHRATVLEPS